MSQGRLGLRWELVSLLITCIGLVLAKRVRWLPQALNSLFIPKAGTEGGQAITEIPAPATILHVQGPGDRRVMWWQCCTGFLVSLR